MILRSHTRAAALLAFGAALAALLALAVLGAFSGSASGLDGPAVATKIRAFAAPPLQPASVPENVRAGLKALSSPESYGSVVLRRFDSCATTSV